MTKKAGEEKLNLPIKNNMTQQQFNEAQKIQTEIKKLEAGADIITNPFIRENARSELDDEKYLNTYISSYKDLINDFVGQVEKRKKELIDKLNKELESI
jgi:hypothetical protein